MNLKQAVVFAILMQNGGGIKQKAPAYVMEKLNSCEKLESPENLLDTDNKALFNEYGRYWQMED